MKTIFGECIEIIKSLVGHDCLYFDNAVEVKFSPHSPPFNAWAVTVSPQDDLYVMDNNKEWHQVEWKDLNAGLVIGTLYQRLMLMRISYAKAS